MRRHGFGFFGLLFMVAWAVGIHQAGTSNAEMSLATSVCLRVGLVLGAIWLAYPQVEELTARVPPWLVGCVLLALGVVIVRPRAIMAVGPILAAIAVLQFLGSAFKPMPRDKRVSERSRAASRRRIEPQRTRDTWFAPQEHRPAKFE